MLTLRQREQTKQDKANEKQSKAQGVTQGVTQGMGRTIVWIAISISDCNEISSFDLKKFNHLINLSKNVIKNKPCIYANLEDFNHFNHLITETIL